MRKEFEYGEFATGAGSGGVGSAGVGLAMADRSVRGQVGQQAPRRRAHGPRPVRPGTAPVGVRPAQACWPAHRVPAPRSGPRVLARSAVAPPVVALRFRVRRAVAGLLVTLVAVAAVVCLGLIADAAAAARAPEPARSSAAALSEVTVTVGPGESLGDVAQRAAPAEDTSVVVARIVTANALTSVRVRPGQVLRVPAG